MNKAEKIKDYYTKGLWTRQMVLNAVGKWITEEEANKILQEGNNLNGNTH